MRLKSWLGRFLVGPGNRSILNRVVRSHVGKLAVALLVVSSAAFLTSGCGGSSSSSSSSLSSTPNAGALYTFFGDAPACDVLAFSMFPSEVDLHQVGQPSTTLVTIWPTNSSPTSPVIEMSTLGDTMTIANLTSIQAGTYDQVVVTAIVDNARTYAPSLSPPISTYSPAVTNSKVTIDLHPNLVITAGKVSALQLDLNLQQSLDVNSQGQLNGSVTWNFASRPLTANSTTGFGSLNDLHGFVTSVNNSSPGSGFTSSFVLQTLSQSASGAGPSLTVDLTDKTKLIGQLVGITKLDQMPTGSYVEVAGYVDQNGNLVANTIQVEDRENVTNQLLGYVGPVLTVTKDSNGNVTQFEMLARETEPEDTGSIPVDTPITVNVSSTTQFNPYLVSSDLTNLASSGNLTFSPQSLSPGEEVVVHGVFNVPSSGMTTVAANSVYPRPQAVQGDFSKLVGTPGSDDKTGVFQLTPCAGILSGHTFMVVTDAQTNFVNTFGLTTLSPTTPLVVRGLAYYSASGTTINNTTIPAGTMVLLASQVRQM